MWSSNTFSTLRQYRSLNSSSAKSPTSYLTHQLRIVFYTFSIIGLISLFLIASYRHFVLRSTLRSQLPKIHSVHSQTNYYQSDVQPDYSKYLIYTPQCVIPNIPVFTFETRRLFQKYYSKNYKCSREDITVRFRRFNYTYVQVPANLRCSAREIVRGAVNEDVAFGNVFNFAPGQSEMDFPESDAVEVTCDSRHTRIIPLIPKKEPFWHLKYRVNPKFDSTPNVLLVGIDSVSRLNFLRQFNETQKFLTEHEFEGPLYGLQKVGDNTWPNLMAMFTGEQQDEWQEALPQNRKLDRLPLIFKAFSKAGFVNTYIENMPNFGLWTFHQKSGFTRQPIEYWLRPVNLMVFKQLNHKYCYKDKLEMELYYDYVNDQMLAFRERGQKYLTMVHMAAVTHDYLNHAQYIDNPVKRFLEKIFDSNLHNNTLIVFYSDHGIRYGEILKTESGFQESRMPFMYFYIPKSMRLLNSHGKWMDSNELKQVFRVNARRVTSNFDIHATLRHVIEQSPAVDEYYGQSLFTPISNERTCEDAGIPNEYCLCRQFEPFTDAEMVSQIANFTVQYLNNQLQLFSNQCHDLTLSRVLKAKISSQHNPSDTERPTKRIFTITIITKPNNGTFEATVQGTMIENAGLEQESLQILGKPLRQDRYAEQSHCVANTQVESVCYCRDLHL